MRAGAKRKRWQESGLTQLTDLAQAAFDNGVGQSGEHSEAAAVSAARRIRDKAELVLTFFDFGFAGRGAALTRRRLVAFVCGSVASTFLFCSKSDQNFAVSCRNCSARTRSCKKRHEAADLGCPLFGR